MKIASYNVNGVNGRLPRILDWLGETSPDVVCLQEIKTTDEKCPAAAIARAGYNSIWHGQRSHHGVAILARSGLPLSEKTGLPLSEKTGLPLSETTGSRSAKKSGSTPPEQPGLPLSESAGIPPTDKRSAPFELRRGLPGADDDTQARYIEAEISDLVVASIYLPNGNPAPGPKFDYKLAWFERLIRHAADLLASNRPVVLAGDFNVVPTDFDIYNAWPWRFDAVMQPETRDAYRRLLAQGWIDSGRHLHPDKKIYTFWVNANAFRKGSGFRMDFLLLSPNLEKRLLEAEVDTEFRGREGASDHAPVWIRLADEADAAR